MNVQAIQQDLKELCAKHGIIMYPDEDAAATVIEGLLTMEEADGGCPPQRVRFDFITSEVFQEYE
jgi:ferredoxin-thioredoxin reductase catalytic subunit